VDRIDLCVREGDTFIKVVDYKTGGTTLDLAEVYYGLSIQLLVYLKAGIDQASQEAGVTCIPGGTFYFHVDDPMVTVTPDEESDLQNRIDKEFKMNGLFLDDPRLMAALDTSNGRYSAIYQKSSGNSRLTREEFDDLLAFTRKVVEDGVTAIWGGKIALQPYRLGDKNPCSVCEYAAICQFDQRLNRAACRVLNAKISKEMLLQKARKEGEAHAMDKGTD
jgi:ATP-dependent helicase/nuclease subunit B